MATAVQELPTQKTASSTTGARNASILLHTERPIAFGQPTAAGKSALGASFEYPATLQGSTAHFSVYYDPSLGAAGATLANGVLARCEQDWQSLVNLFGIQVPHFNVIIAPGIGGAYHDNCAAADLYCDGIAGENTDAVNFLVIAEEVEVFQANQNKGWNCGWSNGEGLSRTLATLLYPAQLDGFTSASSWLNAPGRPDYVNQNEQTDRDYVSIGCSVLFLNYLQTQLGFSWAQIVQAGGATLNDVYQTLTRSADGLTPFKAALQAKFPAGTAVNLNTDNPFPIPVVAVKDTLVDTAVGAPGCDSLHGTTFIAWAGTDGQHHLNVEASSQRYVWRSKVTLADTSPSGCSICAFNNRLYMAWQGTDNRQINVMSSSDGVNWGSKVTLADTCSGRPALAAAGSQLALAWTGTDNPGHLNVMTSADGVHWGNKHTSGETASDGPGLAWFGGRLYIAWAGTDNPHHVNVASSGDLGATWQNKETLGETASAGPALLTNGGQLLLSWAGTDNPHHINVLRSSDGRNFGSKSTLGETTNATPTLAMAYGGPAVVWTGTDNPGHLNLESI